MVGQTLAKMVVNYYKQRAELQTAEYERQQAQKEQQKNSVIGRAQAAFAMRGNIEVPIRRMGAVPEIRDVIACLTSKVASLNKNGIYPIYADPQEVESLADSQEKVAQSVVLFCPGGSLIVSTIGYVNGLPEQSKVMDFETIEALGSSKIFDSAAFSDIAMNYHLAMQYGEVNIGDVVIGMPVVETEETAPHIQDVREEQRWEMLEQEE